MSQGSLMFPPGYTPLYQGSPVTSGKLRFRATGTSDPQNTYSDSTLDTANANPLSLDANGTLTGHVYGDPTLPNYKIELLSSADAVLWTLNDVVVDGADTATISEGSFTGTITGTDESLTGTISYKIVANSAGTGKLCTLSADSAIIATSNTTAMTMTGLPAACTPTADVRVLCEVHENTTAQLALAVIAASGTTITFYTDLPFSATGFTNSGEKGLSAGWQISYQL